MRLWLRAAQRARDEDVERKARILATEDKRLLDRCEEACRQLEYMKVSMDATPKPAGRVSSDDAVSVRSMLPKIAISKDVLPLPTGPTT